MTGEKPTERCTTIHFHDGGDPRATAEVCLYATSARGRPLTLTKTPDGKYALRGSLRGEVVVPTRSASMQLWPDYCADADSDPCEEAVPLVLDEETTSPMPRES